ncbi:MAG: carboxylesterase family protein, partial [Gammaproteobacteria bacterium]|nr:carboxylesterase family protein [Gammaproteobacteria bacterium]
DLDALSLPAISTPNAFTPSRGLRKADNVSVSPAIDGDLIPAPIAETVAARGEANVPFLGGGCRHEGTLFPTTVGFQEHDEASAAALFEAAGVNGQKALAAYERFAPGATPTRKLVYALADTMFRNSMLRILDAAASTGATCWNWMCTWESDVKDLRATHAIELCFVWDWIDRLPAMQRFAGKGAPADLGPAMRAYWVNFARTGTPSAPGEPEWPAHNLDDRPVLLLDAERRIATKFDDEVRQLWFGIGP